MQDKMSIEEVESLFQQGTIEQIVQNMDKGQADSFLSTVYHNVKSFKEMSGLRGKEFDPNFVQTEYHYVGYDLDKKMIYGESETTSFYSGKGVLADEPELSVPTSDNISFEEAESLLRKKFSKEKKETKIESTPQEFFGVNDHDDLVEGNLDPDWSNKWSNNSRTR